MPSTVQTSPCRDVETLLPWYCNGTLSPAETSQVKSHLITCAECRAELRQTRDLLALVARGLPRPERESRRSLPAIPQIDRRSVATAGALRLAAGVLLALGIGYVAGVSRGPEPGPAVHARQEGIEVLPAEAPSAVLMVESFESGTTGNWLVHGSDPRDLESVRSTEDS